MIDKAFDRVTRFIEIVLALAFILAVLLNFTNVIGRYLFGFALLGSDELQVFVMVAMTFLGAAVVTRRNEHLRMDVLVQFMPEPLRFAAADRGTDPLGYPRRLRALAILFLCRGRCSELAEPATWPGCQCGSPTASWRSDLR